MHKTYMAKPSNIEKKWYVVDAKGQTLGRLATEVATILKGKHRPTYTPHMDMGDYVIVINAEGIVLSGKKLDQKHHYWHSGYPGGIKSVDYRTLMERNPERVVMYAVKGMLPKNKLGAQMLRKLKVYRGEDHPHQAQQPEEIVKG